MTETHDNNVRLMFSAPHILLFLRFAASVAVLFSTTTADADTGPTSLLGNELEVLCSVDQSTFQKCSGYVAGVSDNLTIIENSSSLGITAPIIISPCLGNEPSLKLLVATTLVVLKTTAEARAGTAIAVVKSALMHPPGCNQVPSATDPKSKSVFSDGARLKAMCEGKDKNDVLQCEGYIRANADAVLLMLKHPVATHLPNCNPNWHSPEEAIRLTIQYIRTHPEYNRTAAPTIIEAALLPASCALTPRATK